MCCGGKVAPVPEPNIICSGAPKFFASDAWVIAQKFGIDPCSIPGTGRNGLVTRWDVERAK